MTADSLIHIACILFGIAIHRMWVAARPSWPARRRRELPPATARSIARARRAARAQLDCRPSHWVVPARTNFEDP